MDIDDDLRKRIIEACTPDVDGWVLKLVDQRLSRTSDLVDGDQVLNYQGGVTIGISVGWRLSGTGVIALICAFIPNYYLEGDNFGWIFWACVLVFAAITWFILKNIKSLNRRIRIDRNGITLGEIEHEWQHVYDTFIFNPGASFGRTTRSTSFIVVVDKDGSIEQREITYLAVSMYELATVIEYFKPRPAQ